MTRFVLIARVEKVDFADGSYTKTIGDPVLTAHWVDPDFDPEQRVFYHVRVIEIPTPRWIVYDKVRLGAEIPEGTAMTTQEGAYTSPIWCTP